MFDDAMRKDHLSRLESFLQRRSLVRCQSCQRSLKLHQSLFLAIHLLKKSACNAHESRWQRQVFPLSARHIFHPWSLVILGIHSPCSSLNRIYRFLTPASNQLILPRSSRLAFQWLDWLNRHAAFFYTCYRFFRGKLRSSIFQRSLQSIISYLLQRKIHRLPNVQPRLFDFLWWRYLVSHCFRYEQKWSAAIAFLLGCEFQSNVGVPSWR